MALINITINTNNTTEQEAKPSILTRIVALGVGTASALSEGAKAAEAKGNEKLQAYQEEGKKIKERRDLVSDINKMSSEDFEQLKKLLGR